MAAGVPGNVDISSYFATKHSWRGKYKRIFSIGTKAISTYNPVTLEITNQWLYADFYGVTLGSKNSNDFIISMKKGAKTKGQQTMTFSCDQRADAMTDILRLRSLFADFKPHLEPKYNAVKLRWSESTCPVVLQLTACSLDQLDAATGQRLVSYYYKDIDCLIMLSASPYDGAFAVCYGAHQRLHGFSCPQAKVMLDRLVDVASNSVGVSVRLRKEPLLMDQYLALRLGKFSSDDNLVALSEFRVSKISTRYKDPVSRLMSFSETCIIERDPGTYSVVSIQPLSSVFSLIRYTENPQLLAVEFTTMVVRKYMCPERDALLATLLDCVRACGGIDAHVKSSPTKRGLRMVPYHQLVDEETESNHLRLLEKPIGKYTDMLQRFNANIRYRGLQHSVSQEGLFTENKEKLILSSLTALLNYEVDTITMTSEELESYFLALRRLVASKAGFESFTSLPRFRERIGSIVVKSLQRDDNTVTYAAIEMLNALMQPMHENFDLRQEQMNKSSLLQSKKFLEALLEKLNSHVGKNSGGLVISALLDFLTFGLCKPYSETTEGAQFDTLLDLVAGLGRSLFKLFQHPSVAIVKSAGLVMKAIIEEGDPEVTARMQDLALGEGALPRHLHAAMFLQSNDARLLANRQLSRGLVALWLAGNPTGIALLKRVLPLGMVAMLESKELAVEDEISFLMTRDNLKLAEMTVQKSRLPLAALEKHLGHWKQRLGERIGMKSQRDTSKDKPVVLRKPRQRVTIDSNWSLLYQEFGKDHFTPTLIWNHKTREELRDALEIEIRNFTVDKDLSGSSVVSWNHQEFEVLYQCLLDEIRVGDYYLRPLLEDHVESRIYEPGQFFNDLYHRFLLTTKSELKVMCLQAMTKVYGLCHAEIGPFGDTRYFVGMLENCTDKQERDRYLLFIGELLNNQKNAKELVDANGIRVLVDLLTLAHLHTSRATVPLQTNLLESSAEIIRDSEKEWYYGNVEKERLGPFSFHEMKEMWKDNILKQTTRCWAQGLDGWKPLQNISQLKWCLMATGIPLMNETEIAVLILSTLVKLCNFYPSRDGDGAIVRPLPRVKRILADSTCLPHLVQLLLTFHPPIVEKVAVLLHNIILENPVMPRLYLAGIFFFVMMYTGSNVIPIGRLLKDTHLLQAFRPEDSMTTELQQKSILGRILPDAMICYLENHGPEKFSEIFLGEFDTPEAIWNSEMRRLMIEKIAAHLADFTPRLQSNTRALYQYCPIPTIQYPQLESELFCNIYYLRHLCDVAQFPDWPIMDPVRLLRDILEAWNKEVERKPSSLSTDDAYQVLGLPTGVTHDIGVIKKAYFRMAQTYHPDKNPEGREIFDAVSRAYDFLSSKALSGLDGPNPENIILLLKSQSILFMRYKEVLQPYKYAGYPMLIKTIQMETKERDLFSKPASLLVASTELAFHTVNCSALNAEELRRENGLEVLLEALDRCVSVLSKSVKTEEMAPQVCLHITRCFSVSAQFEKCRERIVELPSVIKDICRILHYQNVAGLCIAVADCISNLSVDFWLQTQLLQAGAVWHLMLFLFNYDYTLTESGVEISQDSNQQEVANNLARVSLRALARMGGYYKGEEATPENPALRTALVAMLTPHITKQISVDDADTVLKLLNSNTENPYLIWDNRTRAELLKYLEEQSHNHVRSGECDPSYGADFHFSAHAGELVIGDVFVRVFNEQPTFCLENPAALAKSLLDAVGSQAQYVQSLAQLKKQDIDVIKNEERLKQLSMALLALKNVIRNNAGIEIQCMGHFKLIFSLLRLVHMPMLQQLALEVVSCVASNKQCVAGIADSEVLGYLLPTFNMAQKARMLTLDCLLALMSSTKIVKESLSKGCGLYLLDVFCNSTLAEARARGAELLSKMMSDKLVGPKVRILIMKFLPVIFADAMRDDPTAAVHMFEISHENPELIWNDDSRQRVCSTITRLKVDLYDRQMQDPTFIWKVPENSELDLSNSTDQELVVEGVIIRLFIAQPSWVLRRPREFMVALLDKFVQLAKRSTDVQALGMITQATICFFAAQPPLSDQVPALGHIPQVIEAMVSTEPASVKASLQVIHVLSDNEACVKTMAHCNTLTAVMSAMRSRPDLTSLASEALQRMFDKSVSELVAQGLRSDLIPFVLEQLDSQLIAVKNQSGTKAHLVKTLQSMQMDPVYGAQVTQLLNGSSVWSSYRDQKHDLFITNSNVAGFLAAPVGVAGYLTQVPSSASASSVPPPIDSAEPGPSLLP